MAGDGTRVGIGYIQIMPEMKDFTSAVKSETGKSLESAGEAGGSSFGEGLKRGVTVAAAAVTAAAGAVAAFGASSVKAGMDFDSSMSQVAATMGTTVDEIGNLREFAQEMGRTTAFSATEAADALNYMALAGYDAETSMEMLPTVLNLAAAGGIDLASASDMVTDAQSALGLELDETSELVDKMAKASSKSNTSVAQLGEAILKIGGTANIMSGGTTELATSLGILADNGIKGAEGGTHLRNILLSLAAPTDKAAGELENLGVSAVDSEGNMRPLQDIMLDLNDSLDGLGEADKARIISEIFNKTDIAAVNALLGTNVERWEELAGAIDDSAGAAQAMADTQLDNLAGDITLFKSAMEGAQIVLSDVLTPSLREFVQFGTSAVSDLTAAFKEDGLSGAMSVLGEYISEGLGMIIDALPDFVDAGMSLLESLAQGLIENLPAIVETGAEIAGNLITGIAESLPGMIGDIVSVLPGLITILTTELLPAVIEGTIELAAGLIVELPNILGSIVSAIPDILLGLLSGIADGVTRAVADIFQIEGLQEALGLRNAADELQADVDRMCEQFDRYVEKHEETLQKIEARVGLYESIKDDLQKYTDANGNIKQGYEDEVEALQLLAEQYGITIEVRDGQVQNIEGVISSIDQLIEKYEQEAYTAAETAHIEEAYEKRRGLVAEYYEAVDTYYESIGLAQEELDAGNRKSANEAEQAARTAMNAAIESAQKIVESDGEIELSKQNLAAIAEGEYDKICYTTEQAGIEIDANNTEIGNSLSKLKDDMVANSTEMADKWGTVISSFDTRKDLEEVLATFDEIFPGLGEIVAEAVQEIEGSTEQMGQSVQNMSQDVAVELDIVEQDWSDIFTVQIPEDIDVAADAVENFPTNAASVVVDERPQVEAAVKGVADTFEISEETGIHGTDAGTQFNEGLAGTEGEIEVTAENIADTVTSAMDPLPDEMNAAGDESGSNLESGFGNWRGTISGTVDDTYNFFYDTLGTMLPPLMSQWGSDSAQKFNSGLNIWAGDIEATADQIASDVDNALAVLPGWLEAEGYNGGAGLYNGLASWEGALYSLASNIAWNISSTIRAAFNSHSPSRVAMEIGSDYFEGMAIGMEDSGELAVDTADDIAMEIIGTSSQYDYEGISYSGSGAEGYLEEIIVLLDELRNLQVVMDSGELVGVLSPGISEEFGRMSRMQERG